MGTSTGWAGPRWGELLGAAKRSVRDEYAARPMPRQRAGDVHDAAWAAHWGGRLLERLHSDLEEDPDAYGLRSRATIMGRELVLAVAALRERDGVPGGRMPLVADIAIRVVGTGTAVVDAVGRRAVVRAGERLFPLPDDALFCLIYREFFADLVVEFLRAVIAEEINAAFPALVLVDPAGEIADWMAGRLVALVPDPCAEVLPGRSLLEVAVHRVPDAVDAVLGVRGPE
jgi:hypothetical protein